MNNPPKQPDNTYPRRCNNNPREVSDCPATKEDYPALPVHSGKFISTLAHINHRCERIELKRENQKSGELPPSQHPGHNSECLSLPFVFTKFFDQLYTKPILLCQVVKKKGDIAENQRNQGHYDTTLHCSVFPYHEGVEPIVKRVCHNVFNYDSNKEEERSALQFCCCL